MKKFIVKQNDIADCGACSLASIIKYYDGYVPLEIIKYDSLTTEHGTNFYNLKNAALKYGFDVVGLCGDKVKEEQPPYIAQIKYQNLYHFIVVYKENNNNFICMDPAVGIKKYSKKEFEHIFNGNILKLKPIGKIIKYRKNNQFKDNLLKFYKDNLLLLILIFFLTLIIIGISLYNTYSIKLILNMHYHLIIVLLLLSIAKNALNYISNNILVHLNKKINNNLMESYIMKFFHLPSKYLQLKTSGEITSRIYDLNNIKDFFTKELINIIIAAIFLTCSTTMMLYLNYKLTILLIIASIIYLLINYLINNKSFNYYMQYLDKETIFNNYLIEYTEKIHTIKNLGKEDFFLNKINNYVKENNNSVYNLNKYLNKLHLFSNIFNDLCLILILLLSIGQGMDNILIYILYYNYFNENINYYSNLIPNLKYIKGIIAKISEIYYIEEKTAKNSLKTHNNSIKISRLEYTIGLNKIFEKITLNIKENSKILITGPNGVGKTSLLNILNGNISDFKGQVLIDNKNIKGISQKSLKKDVLYVSENDRLFKDTILNNIILDKEYNEEKLQIIENLLDLHEIKNKKNNGYNSLINDNLSRGEEQKIILARAIYQDSNILLLDEALSAISYKSRIIIINKLNKYFKNKTIIYVGHNINPALFNKVVNLTVRKE